MAPKPYEPTVCISDPVPPGYRFLRKGNVYSTANCRRLTHTAGKPVFVVLDTNGKSTLGIRVPRDIVASVLDAERQTRETRAEAVRKKDDATAQEFETAVLSQFPRVPKEVVPRIVAHALVKRKKRVARTGTLDLENRVRLAVWAHVRHCHTEYDKLLRDGTEREKARQEVQSRIAEVMRDWAGKQHSLGTKTMTDHKTRRAELKKALATSRGNGRPERPKRRASVESIRKTRQMVGAINNAEKTRAWGKNTTRTSEQHARQQHQGYYNDSDLDFVVPDGYESDSDW